MKYQHTQNIKQRWVIQQPAVQRLTVACLCILGLSACANHEKAISWQQDKPEIQNGIQVVQHEQQVTADQLSEQQKIIKNMQDKINSLEQLSSQHASNLDILSKYVEALHRTKKGKAKTQPRPSTPHFSSQKTAKTRAKTAIKQHPTPLAALPITKLPAVAANPAPPKIDQSAIDEAEKNTYTAAYLALKSGRFAEASQAFNKQLNDYPKGQYTDQAWYWLGETRLAQGDNNKAMDAFKYVADHYDNSVKHAASLLKLGQLSQSQNHNAAASQYYLRLIQRHPDSNLAEQARAALSNLPQVSENQQ